MKQGKEKRAKNIPGMPRTSSILLSATGDLPLGDGAVEERTDGAVEEHSSDDAVLRGLSERKRRCGTMK